MGHTREETTKAFEIDGGHLKCGSVVGVGCNVPSFKVELLSLRHEHILINLNAKEKEKKSICIIQVKKSKGSYVLQVISWAIEVNDKTLHNFSGLQPQAPINSFSIKCI